MNSENRSKNRVMFVIAAILVVLLLFFGFKSLSNPSSGPGSAPALDAEASSTLTNGVDLAKWLAQEYPAQGN